MNRTPWARKEAQERKANACPDSKGQAPFSEDDQLRLRLFRRKSLLPSPTLILQIEQAGTAAVLAKIAKTVG